MPSDPSPPPTRLAPPAPARHPQPLPDHPHRSGPAVVCDDLVVRYGPLEAVRGISLEAHPGEVVALLGPNGAGKTTTVETLEGYRRPTSGRVRVLGLDPRTDHRALVRQVGIMLQSGGVYPLLDPRRALRLFASYYDHPEDPEELLDLVGLRPVAATPWRHLSGGEQQRLSLALALVGRPQVAFLDEPTAGVDPEGRRDLRQVVADLRRRGACVVVTTHELAEAEKMADRMIVVRHGRVVASGTPAQLSAAGTAPGGFSFGAPPALDRAALSAALGAPVEESAPGRYRVHAPPTPASTAALATWLADHQVPLTDLQTAPSLEETYLALVGQDSTGPDPAALDQPGGPRRRRASSRRGTR